MNKFGNFTLNCRLFLDKMPRKSISKEEILEKARLSRRRRYEYIKSDPVLYAKEKEKEHQRYIKRKEQKKILSVHEMTPRARRQQRKKWRENFKRHYENKRLRNRGLELMNANTPSCSENEDPLVRDRNEDDTDECLNHMQEQYLIDPLLDSQPSTTQAQETSIVVKLKQKVRRLRYIMIQKK